MDRELLGVGRGYLLAFLALLIYGALVVIWAIKVPTQISTAVNSFGNFIMVFGPLVIGAKEGGKALGKLADRPKSDHRQPQNNGG